MNQLRWSTGEEFIRKGLRFRFIKVIIIVFVLLLIISEISLYILIRNFIFSLPTAEPQISVLRFGFWCMFTLLIFGILSCVIVILVLLHFMHRVLGPIPRLEEEIDKMLRSGEYKKLEIRRTDLLRDFVSRINILLQVLFNQRRKDEKRNSSC